MSRGICPRTVVDICPGVFCMGVIDRWVYGLQWLNSYLRSRPRTITIMDTMSVFEQVLFRALQGSVLGPLLTHDCMLLFTIRIHLAWVKWWRLYNAVLLILGFGYSEIDLKWMTVKQIWSSFPLNVAVGGGDLYNLLANLEILVCSWMCLLLWTLISSECVKFRISSWIPFELSKMFCRMRLLGD